MFGCEHMEGRELTGELATASFKLSISMLSACWSSPPGRLVCSRQLCQLRALSLGFGDGIQLPQLNNAGLPRNVHAAIKHTLAEHSKRTCTYGAAVACATT